jgi:septation ring formation regulator EzrA
MVESAFSWLGQKVPIWGVLIIGLAFGSGLGLLGGSLHNEVGFDERSSAIITEHISQLRADQATLTGELRQTVQELHMAMDKKVDVESKRELIENFSRRLDGIEKHMESLSIRFDQLSDSLRSSGHAH